MIEVEIKLPISEADTVKGKLLEQGFRESGWLQEYDVYFDDARNSVRRNGEALRVRETRDCRTDRVSAQLNFKGKKLDAATMTRQELEVGVEDGDTCRELLQAIGYFPAVPQVRKERRMLKKDEVTACLDRVQGLGDFLELEILAVREEEKDAALRKIEGILRRLGYRISDTVQTSYLSMLQKKLQCAEERHRELGEKSRRKNGEIILKSLADDFTVCKVADLAQIKLRGEFFFLGKTDQENSLVCQTRAVPLNTTEREDGWKAFRIEGVLDFSLTGILSGITSLLAEAEIAVFAVSTYNTDYVLVKREKETEALDILAAAGYQII